MSISTVHFPHERIICFSNYYSPFSSAIEFHSTRRFLLCKSNSSLIVDDPCISWQLPPVLVDDSACVRRRYSRFGPNYSELFSASIFSLTYSYFYSNLDSYSMNSCWLDFSVISKNFELFIVESTSYKYSLGRIFHRIKRAFSFSHYLWFSIRLAWW